MTNEVEFKKWFDSTNFKRLNMSSADKMMLLLSFERGADMMRSSIVKKYNLTLKDGE